MRCYGLLNTAIEVACDPPAALQWLDEFLTPAFEVRSGEKADFCVAILAEEAAYRDADCDWYRRSSRSARLS